MSQHDSVPDSRVVVDVGEGQATQDAGSWSVRRSLSGGGLPGQARAVSGSSVGSGQVQIVSSAGRSPWTPGPVRPGGRVGIEARADVDRPWSSVAQMVAREVSGTARSRALDVSVEDDVSSLSTQTTVGEQVKIVPSNDLTYVIDAAASVEAAAQGAGMGSSSPMPPPGFRRHLIAPLVGSDVPLVGINDFPGPGGGVELGGQACHRAAAFHLDGTPTGVTHVAMRVHVTEHVTGATRVTFSVPATTMWVEVLAAVSGPSRASISSASTPLTSTPAVQGGAGWRLYEVRVDMRAPTWTLSMRSAGGPWTAPVPVPGPYPPSSGTVWYIESRANDSWSNNGIYDVRVLSSDTPMEDTSLPVTPAARIGLTGSPIYASPATSGSSWDTIQQVARATLGAAWIDEDGRLRYRGRDSLRTGAVTETVVSEESLEDVPWSISSDEVADRVEVRYAPTIVVRRSGMASAPTVWESTATVEVRAGATVTVTADIESAVGGPTIWWQPVFDPWVAAVESRWNAFPNPDGTGAEPPSSALEVTTEYVGTHRALVRIRNTTGAPLYVTQLTMRAAVSVQAGEPQTLSWGAPAESARTPFTLDCGSWVQDEDTAREILQWLADTLSQPLPVLRGVRVVPDTARRLGSIVKVIDRTTALTAKAIVTGIDTSHSPGELTQRLDLTILWVTEADVATRWTSLALATEANVATYLTSTLGSSATEADLAAWLPTGVI